MNQVTFREPHLSSCPGPTTRPPQNPAFLLQHLLHQSLYLPLGIIGSGVSEIWVQTQAPPLMSSMTLYKALIFLVLVSLGCRNTMPHTRRLKPQAFSSQGSGTWEVPRARCQPIGILLRALSWLADNHLPSVSLDDGEKCALASSSSYKDTNPVMEALPS